MTQINLLPWREDARRNEKIQFGIILAGIIVLAFLQFFSFTYT